MKAITVAFVALTAVLIGSPAFAGPYADDLAKCLVRSTSETDKTGLVKWMFASASLHPAVKAISAVTDADRADLNKGTAALYERLLTEACRSEAQDAVRYEGPLALQYSFQILGHVAATSLFSDPGVVRGMADVDDRLDKRKFEALFVR